MYDEQSVAEITTALRAADEDLHAVQVRAYERAHKNRAGVIKAAERDAAKA